MCRWEMLLFACCLFVGSGVEGMANEGNAPSGLAVYVGCRDASWSEFVAARPHAVIQLLDTDRNTVAAVQRQLDQRNWTPRVSTAAFDGHRLPYIDNVVNELVVSPIGGASAARVSSAELLRVLVPGAVAKLGDGRRLVKPRPKNTDQWTHYLHGPDNNAVAQDTVVGPPRHLQWLAPPRWTRDHGSLNSISSVVTAGGRLFSILDLAGGRDMSQPAEWFLQARDAFNGLELWRKPIARWASTRIRFRAGPPQLPRLLVADASSVYAPLALGAAVSKLDAATGQVVQSFVGTEGAEELLLVKDLMLVLAGSPDGVAAAGQARPSVRKGQPQPPPYRNRIVAVDLNTGKLRWTTPLEGAVRAETLASDGQHVLVQVDDEVRCWRLSDGKAQWTYRSPDVVEDREPAPKSRGRQRTAGRGNPGFGRHVLVVADGVVLCNLRNELTAISAETGHRLWVAPGGQGFHAPLDLFVIDRLVWTGNHPQDSTAPPPVHDFSVARDLHSGAVVSQNQIMADLQTVGHHHRCYRNKATVNFILSGKRGIEFMDLHGDGHVRNNWVRGTCQYGILPANGLIYAPPHSCGCYPESMIRGFCALAGAQSPALKEPEQRLVTGPAYQDVQKELGAGDQAATAKPRDAVASRGAQDWPSFRAGAGRSGVVAVKLPHQLHERWSVALGGRLSQPTVAGDIVLVSRIDHHQVCALRATDGSLVWSRTVGGRVDSPPTIYAGRLCLFGSADGSVYCLRLEDGAEVWRFLAAPVDRRTIVWGQIESSWPVHGSVLVHRRLAYFSAGRSTWFDGGIALYAVDPVSGRVRHSARLQSQPPRFRAGKDRLAEYRERAEAFEKMVLGKNQRGSSRADYKSYAQSDRAVSFSMAGGTISDVMVGRADRVYLHQVAFDLKLNQLPTANRHLFSTSGFLHDPNEESRSHWVLGDGDFSQYPLPYTRYVGGDSRNPACGMTLSYSETAAWSLLRSRRYSKSPVCQLVSTRLNGEGARPAWNESLGSFVPRSIVKTPVQLVVGGIEDGQAVVQLHSVDDGKLLTRLELPSAMVWDGAAAASGRLFVALVDGRLTCLD